MEKFLALPFIKYSIITIITLIIALVISKILRVLIDKFIKQSTVKLKIDHTQFNFLKNAVTFIVFMGAIIFIFFTIPKLKALSLGLFAGAGILTAIALFASQQAFVWSKDHPSGVEMKSDLNKSIKKQFDKNGIEIPFPYRTIVYKDK